MADNFLRLGFVLIVAIITSFFPSCVSAQITLTLNATGQTTWSVEMLGPGDIASPGAAFPTPMQSPANQFYLHVQNSVLGKNWQIYVQRNYTGMWNDAMRLYIRRITNNSYVWGGQAFVYIPYAGEGFGPNPNTFFGGTTDIDGIYIQLQIDLPLSELYAGMFTTSITYTIIDNL